MTQLAPTRDTEGLQSAAYELMEEALLFPMKYRSNTEDETRQPHRKLSPGYYVRVEYLTWLQRTIEAGGKFELAADELEGIAAIAAAKSEFSQEHPGCSSCGQAQYSRTATSCHGCGVKFGRPR